MSAISYPQRKSPPLPKDFLPHKAFAVSRKCYTLERIAE